MSKEEIINLIQGFNSSLDVHFLETLSKAELRGYAEHLKALRMNPEDVESLTESMQLVEALKPWIKDVERVVFEQLNAGVKVVGWKLVAKRALAKWDDEDSVLRAFRRKLGGINNITVRKLLSPAQMRKLAKVRGAEERLDSLIDAHTIKTSSGNTMAPESDKRPAVLSGEAMAAALKALT